MTLSKARWPPAACEAFQIILWDANSSREGLLGWILCGLAMFY